LHPESLRLAFTGVGGNRSCGREKIDTYLGFSEKISFLALILREFADSSPGLSFGRRGGIAVISANPERFQGETLEERQIRFQGLFWAISL
jgi:hypothetical protein